jgi:hypothetical protein
VIHIFVSAFSDLSVKQIGDVQTVPCITEVHIFYTTMKCSNNLANLTVAFECYIHPMPLHYVLSMC